MSFRLPAPSRARTLAASSLTKYPLVLIFICTPACSKKNDAPQPETTTASVCTIDTNFSWTSSERLIDPVSDATHPLVSIKDPSVVYFEDRWHIYATSADTAGNWSLVYLNFDKWENAQDAKPYYLDQTPGLSGYHAAPHVFYFRPHKKWYLIYQSQHPQYSTTDDLSKPESWSEPKSFFTGKPASAPDLWIDYWVICDTANCYLFFTGDDGAFYRSQTSIESFPEGMTDPVVVMQQDRFDLFEGNATYKLEGQNKYLTLTEGIGGPDGNRFYKAWTANTLDGNWTPLTDSWEFPFAGENNTTFDGTRWTRDISHGELIRSGYDETMSLRPCDMQLLYQGRDPNISTDDYSQLPYGLGLLTQGPSDPSLAALNAEALLPPELREPAMLAEGDANNLVTNSGFETGTDGWGAWGADLSASTERAHSGMQSGLAGARTATWNGAAWPLLGDALAGEEYSALAWVTVSAGSQSVSLSTKTTCGSDEVYANVASIQAESSGWAELRGSFVAPTCEDLQEFLIYVEGPAEGVDLYLDDVWVVHSSIDLDTLMSGASSSPTAALGDAGTLGDASVVTSTEPQPDASTQLDGGPRSADGAAP